MRFTRGDVRDHIVSSKIDHGPPWWRGKATRQQRSPKIDFREIFRLVRFSTFATISANSGKWFPATVAHTGRWYTVYTEPRAAKRFPMPMESKSAVVHADIAQDVDEIVN